MCTKEVNCTFFISVRALELPHSGLQVHPSAIALENCSGCRSIHLLFLEHRITAFSRQQQQNLCTMSLLQTRKCSQNNLCVSILSLLKNAISCFFASVYEHDGRENLITVEYFNTITTQPLLFSCYPPV